MKFEPPIIKIFILVQTPDERLDATYISLRYPIVFSATIKIKPCEPLVHKKHARINLAPIIDFNYLGAKLINEIILILKGFLRCLNMLMVLY